MTTDMNKTPMIWTIVPAAGIGQRMGAGLPKQYLPLLDKTILEHTLLRLISHPKLAQVVLVLHEDDPYWPKCRLYDHPAIMAVPGGRERFYSVFNALKALHRYAEQDDWVLVHDAVRPCVRHKDIDKLLTRLVDHEVGGLLAAPIVQTVKRSGPGANVIETVPREELWTAQTPQMFRYGLLREAISRVIDSEIAVTDDAQAIEQLGLQPLLIEGSHDNLKITHPSDIPVAEYYLQQQPDVHGVMVN